MNLFNSAHFVNTATAFIIVMVIGAILEFFAWL